MELAQAQEAAEEAERRATRAEADAARLGDDLSATRAALERAQNAAAADRYIAPPAPRLIICLMHPQQC